VTAPFAILALLTLGGAIAAMSLRNLVHCALALVVTFAGLAGLYLLLDAQFVGLAQVLVYVGAVAILIVFAILLTRSGEVSGGVAGEQPWLGLGIAALVAACLGAAVLQSPALIHTGRPTVEAKVKSIGTELMTNYVLPLEAVGLLLTAALIGAVIIALREKDGAK
jgi:NADH-quinone oxidoreductase subunit J